MTVMKNKCTLCWSILGFFLIANMVLLGLWWFDKKEEKIPENDKIEQPEFRNRMQDLLSREAGVEKEEFEEMFKLMSQHKRGMWKYKADLDSLRRVLMDQTFSYDEGDEKINEIIDKMTVLQREVELMNYHHFRQMRAVCKDDNQREKLERLYKNFSDRHHRGGRQIRKHKKRR